MALLLKPLSAPALVAAFGLSPNKSLGQNFLKDPALGEKIAGLVNPGETDTVLEIGAGLGTLTLYLGVRAKKVLAVEWDKRLFEVLCRQVDGSGLTNVTLIQADILKTDIPGLAAQAGAPLLVVGNLPYQISSQVLMKLVAEKNSVSRAVLMFQEELAQRLLSEPGSRDWGRVTVLTRYAARVRPLLSLSPAQFFPRPQVASRLLEFSFHEAPEFPVKSWDLFSRLVAAAFGMRRKTLRNALAGSSLGLLPREAEEVLKLGGIDPKRRAEELSVREFVGLEHALNGFLEKKGA